MTKYNTTAVFNGTKVNVAISGGSVNEVFRKIRKMRELREASVFLFKSRKTGNLVDVRMN